MKLDATHPANCTKCETHETRYIIHLSVILTLTGAPGCLDNRALLENAASYLNTLVELKDDGDVAIDRVEVDGVTTDDWFTENKPIKLPAGLTRS
jgi:hypothetical protein